MAVGFGGLSEDESNLIKVAKFFHDNEEQFEMTVVKLVRSMGLNVDSVAAMTSLTPGKVRGVIRRKGYLAEFTHQKPELKSSNETEITGQLEPTGNVKPEPRFNTETFAGRIAQEYFEQITSKTDKRFRSRDVFVTRKAMMNEKECTSATAGEVFKLLADDDLIEFAEPGNFRKGYVVK